MGLTANLAEAWEPYKAAISALVNTLETSNLKDYSSKRHAKLQVFRRIALKFGVMFNWNSFTENFESK
jgi:Hereditary spastic paraplegia protein strumpellin